MSVDSATQRARRELLKKEGVCVDCRRSKAKKSHTLCQVCMDERSARYLKKKAEKESFIEENGSVVERKMQIADRLYRLMRYAAVLILIVCSGYVNAKILRKRETSLQPESCYDRISKGREAFFDAARVSNNANTVDDLLSLYRQTSQPGTIRMICTNKRAADMFEIKVSLANYIAKVGDAR